MLEEWGHRRPGKVVPPNMEAVSALLAKRIPGVIAISKETGEIVKNLLGDLLIADNVTDLIALIRLQHPNVFYRILCMPGKRKR